MECGISIDNSVQDGTVLQHKTVKARKPHLCGECGQEISKGDDYEIYTADIDGKIFRARTCKTCVCLRDAFFVSWDFGAVREDLREHIRFVLGGHVPSECILSLADEARDIVFELIEEVWDSRADPLSF